MVKIDHDGIELDYYTENPVSYAVVKPTYLVLDYIKDIKDLLKGE